MNKHQTVQQQIVLC